MGKIVRNILVLTSWAYDEGLVQSSVLPYLKMIHAISPRSQIYLVTEEKRNWFKEPEFAGVQENLQNFNVRLLPQVYHRFGIKKLFFSLIHFIRLCWIVVQNKVSHIHCFCTPAGSIGYILSTITGKKLIIDSYEPHAEAMVENGTWRKEGLAFKLLWWLEKKQSQKADYCLAAATGMDKYAYKKYGVNINLAGVRPCCVDLENFTFRESSRIDIRRKLGWERKTVCVYAGKFGGIYLDREVFEFFKAAYLYWGDDFRILLLTNTPENEITEYCRKAELPRQIIYSKVAPLC